MFWSVLGNPGFREQVTKVSGGEDGRDARQCPSRSRPVVSASALGA